jgi:hypothetical protein
VLEFAQVEAVFNWCLGFQYHNTKLYPIMKKLKETFILKYGLLHREVGKHDSYVQHELELKDGASLFR